MWVVPDPNPNSGRSGLPLDKQFYGPAVPVARDGRPSSFSFDYLWA